MDLKSFFQEHKKVALAFSGGVDSSYLLYAAKKYGADVKAYFVKSCFQPSFELEDARKLSDTLAANIKILYSDVLGDEKVVKNSDERCYFCKLNIFRDIIEAAKEDGYDTVVDGTNASDDASDRPGMKALREMNVLSPLRLCGITKNDVRRLSKEAGLFTWDKPAYACLATRIPTGIPIDGEDLLKVEGAEKRLFTLGFRDFRVRMFNKGARIQLKEEEMLRAVTMRKDIVEALKEYFDVILLDMEER